jgi:hypothetical protein
MADPPANLRAPTRSPFFFLRARARNLAHPRNLVGWRCALFTSAMFAALLLFAQSSPHIVSAVFLSDDKNDYKATVVEQADDKIVMKVPQVKVGSYNVSIQQGDKIIIMPVHFKVEQ